MYPNLKLQIFKAGVRQSQLAKRLGMGETILSKIINGYREPSESERQALAECLKAEESWLFEAFENHREPLQIFGSVKEPANDRDR